MDRTDPLVRQEMELEARINRQITWGMHAVAFLGGAANPPLVFQGMGSIIIGLTAGISAGNENYIRTGKKASLPLFLHYFANTLIIQPSSAAFFQWARENGPELYDTLEKYLDIGREALPVMQEAALNYGHQISTYLQNL